MNLGKDQERINEIIIDILNGNRQTAHAEILGALCDDVHAHGADAILLACTDLQHVHPHTHSTVRIFDTTQILIDATVHYMMQ